MVEREEGFLARWARLKRGEREESATPAVQETGPENSPPVAIDPAVEPAGEPADPNADLPPIESLDRYSDYTVFLRAGVAPELRKQALAKLWRSDPVFANLDGLLEYGEDYSLPFKMPRLVATAYQVGKGMVEPSLQESAAAEAASSEKNSEALDAPVIAAPPEDDSADAKNETREASDAGRLPPDRQG